MKEELQDALYEKYPDIFVQKDLPMHQTCMCWGIDTCDGWYKIIDALCQRIKWYVAYHPEAKVQAVQVKEKWGQLSFYYNGGDDYIEGAVDMACTMSGFTCEFCGAAGKVRKLGWVRTLCDSCHDNHIKQFTQAPTGALNALLEEREEGR